MSNWKMSDEVSEKKTLPSELDKEDQSYEQEEYLGSLNRFPDEILLQIFNKLFDLKCLCRCSLVSKRFSSLILHVHSVSFTVPRLIDPQNPNPNPNPIPENFPQKLSRFFTTGVVAKPFQFLRRIVAPKPLPAVLSSFYGDSFRSSVQFLNRFEGIRSLRIQLPSSFHGGGNPHDSLFKWTAKFGSRIESFVFVSPTSILKMERLADDGEEEVDSGLTAEFLKQRVHMAFQCLKDVIVRHRFILFFVEEHPLLQSIEISDSEKQGRLYLGAGQVAEVRNSIGARKVNLKLERLEVPISVYQSFVPVLELPVSGFAMKGATLVLMEMIERDNGNSLDVVGNGFGDGKDVYDEAVVEIMTKHRNKMKKLL